MKEKKKDSGKKSRGLGRMLGVLWQRPLVRVDEEEDRERKASWLELFFDLIFVAVISRLSHYLAAHISIEGALRFSLLFVPVWLVWLGATYYNERFEVNDIRHRVLMFLQIIPIAGMAISAEHAFDSMSHIFILSYITVRIIQVIGWLSAAIGHDEYTRKTTLRYAVGFSLSIVCWGASLFIPPPYRYLAWGAGLLIDIITPRTTLKLQAKMPKLSKSHLPERFGLFMIIVIAESVLGVVNGLTNNSVFTIETIGVAVLALVISFQIWWIYFDHIMYRPFKHGVGWIASWSLLHLPLSLVIAGLGAGIHVMVSHAEEVIARDVVLLSGGAVASMLIVMGVLGVTLDKKDFHGRIHFFRHINIHFLIMKILAGAAFFAACWFMGGFTPLVFLGIVAGVLFVQIVQGLGFWARAHM